MTRTYVPRTDRSRYPTWWLRHGGWVILALLAVVWFLPLPGVVHVSACAVLFVASIRIHAGQVAHRAVRRSGGAS